MIKSEPKKKPQPKPSASALKSEDGLTLVHLDYDSTIHHLRDLTRQILNEIAAHGFKDLFDDPVCREKILEIYEARKGRMMVEDKMTLLSLKRESIDVMIPEHTGVRFDFDGTIKTRSAAIA